MKLTGNTILITGGSSGYGLALAKRLALHNKVLICGRDLHKLEEAKRAVPQIDFLQCDISQSAEISRLVSWVNTDHPELNVLVNNAAVVHQENFLTDDETLDKAELEFAVNLLAPIRLSKLLLPVLSGNSSPAIINITTGLVYIPRVKYTYYNASKAALHSFSQVIRSQLSASLVKIIEILLPVVDTPWHQGNPPKIAISADTAVALSLKGLEKGKLEIRVGKVKLLYLLARMAPAFAFRKLNALE
ncbi:SDR family oxidoreductase [Paradesertivirga mongoliensis]|uniref:SDR family oxidoreductase n=1 Tax=Paradesertivirga mongoliensis TaxID=2100740 RepID=A0ABW4ZIG9_9SPHI|nr:SDR family NAD(P)-dependent oxidoreductase [Pedobacter mongoliensis]